MNAEIVTIGTELLIGQVINTNAAWIATELNGIGISVAQVTSIPDEHAAIVTTLGEAMQRADLVLITGGLGPTKDDITKQALCELFGCGLITDEPTLKYIQKLFWKRGIPTTETNRRQAEVPACCKPVFNRLGTAPGMWFEKEHHIIISMPGVPFEMEAMMTRNILPALKRQMGQRVILHRMVNTQGIGESHLSDRIAEWEDRLPPHIRLAYLPQPGIVRLRLTAAGKEEEILERELSGLIRELHDLIPEYIYGYGDVTLEEVIGELLRKEKATLATAESCTGGYIAHLITSVAGSSDYYIGSVVAYSNQIKQQMLGVDHQTLLDHGAVSEEVVKEMAAGAQRKFSADYAIATSGIAGPTGGTPGKPVGLVWIAVATPSGIKAEKHLFGDHRIRNIRRTAVSALNMLRRSVIRSPHPLSPSPEREGE